jgi:hypothetical protein
MIHGRQPNWVSGAGVQFPAVLESLLKQLGQSPARPIPATFDAFMEAYLAPGSVALDRHLQEEIIARATHEV